MAKCLDGGQAVLLVLSSSNLFLFPVLCGREFFSSENYLRRAAPGLAGPRFAARRLAPLCSCCGHSLAALIKPLGYVTNSVANATFG